MKAQKNLEIIALFVYLLVGVSVFYNLNYSNLRKKYVNMLDNYSEAQNEIVQSQLNFTQYKYYYEVIEDQFDTLQMEHNYLKSEYYSLKLNHTRLIEKYSSLQKKYYNLKNEMEPPDPPFKGDPGSSPEYAAEIGSRITCPFLFNETPGYEVVIKVVNVILGEDAYEELNLRNTSVQAPRYKHGYLLIKIQIEYTKAPKPISFEEGFRVFSTKGDLYDPPLAYSLEPYLGDVIFYKDWRAEGWLTYEVPENYTTFLLGFASRGHFTSGYWFKLFS